MLINQKKKVEKSKECNEKIKGKGKNGKNKFSKKLKIIILGVLILFLTFAFAYNRYSTKAIEEIPYNDFLSQIEVGEISKIKINTSSGFVYFTNDTTKESYKTDYPYSDNFVENMLLAGVDVEVKKSSGISAWNIIYIVLVVSSWFMLRSSFKGIGSPSKKDKVVTTSDVKFTNVAGMEEIKEDMKFLIEMIKNEEYRKRGAKIPKGILLQGPPGNGKTLLAKALAGECGINFVSIDASEFNSPFIGIGGNKIIKTFKDAKEKSPCIIFIDEIDSIGSSRMSAESAAAREYNSILTTLLSQMDGFTSADGVMVLAATNRAEELDPALLRPGRFDRKFTVGYPDKHARKELFELYTKDLKLESDVNIDEFIRQTYGCSCAEIRNIINEAIINSVANKHERVSADDISDALVRSSINGLIKKNAKWEGRTKDIVAYHEAGHAIVAHFFAHKQISKINIMPTTSNAGGFTVIENEDDKITELSDYRGQIAVLYGGKAAESIFGGGNDNISTGASNDIHRATKMAMSYVNFKDGVDYSVFGAKGTEIITEKVKEELDGLYKEALAAVEKYWEETKMVAEVLKVKEMISGKEFLEIIAEKKDEN